MKLKEKKFNIKEIVIDLWDGKITLWKTYWGLVLPGAILFCLVELLVPEERYAIYSFRNILYIIFSIFVLICVWRSANKYQGKKIWYFLAKFSCTLYVMLSSYFALVYGNLFGS
jgi:hypothetical protein